MAFVVLIRDMCAVHSYRNAYLYINTFILYIVQLSLLKAAVALSIFLITVVYNQLELLFNPVITMLQNVFECAVKVF